jgi:hypothetical protein
MSLSEERSALVMELAEEFLDRYRKGERPSFREYIDRHPEFAAEIKEVFPAMAMMENIANAGRGLCCTTPPPPTLPLRETKPTGSRASPRNSR